MAQWLNGEGFAQELFKIAIDVAYRKVRGERSELRSDIPLVSMNRKLAPDKALARISKAVDKSRGRILGHETVAVRTSQMPSVKTMGFKPTRLAVPLSGEKGLFPVSYRKGRVHGHQVGGLTLFHHDKMPPEGIKTVVHGLTEGIPALIKRFQKEYVPPLREFALPVKQAK